MPPKNKLDLKKVEADRLSGFLQELLREEENKYCADCEAKQPRWASWNLGVFLCIRCAGLHRNLGVHISKVKSVNLDTWTAEQVQSMRIMGNSKAKAVYEYELPQMFRRPQSDQVLETFIRAKYESRRYILRDWVPPSVNSTDLNTDLELEKLSEKSNTSNLPSKEIAKSKTNQSIVFERNTLTTLNQKPKIVDLFDLQTSSDPNRRLFSVDNKLSCESNNLDNFFGPIISAPVSIRTNAVLNRPAENVKINTETVLPVNNDLEVNFFDNAIVGDNVVNRQKDIFDSNISDKDVTGINFSNAVLDIKKSNSDILALFENGTSQLPSIKNQLPSQYNFGSGISVPQQQPKHFITSSVVNLTNDGSLTNKEVLLPQPVPCNNNMQNLNTNQSTVNFGNQFSSTSVNNFEFSSHFPLNLVESANINDLSGLSSIKNVTSRAETHSTNRSCSEFTSSGLDDLFGQFKL